MTLHKGTKFTKSPIHCNTLTRLMCNEINRMCNEIDRILTQTDEVNPFCSKFWEANPTPKLLLQHTSSWYSQS